MFDKTTLTNHWLEAHAHARVITCTPTMAGIGTTVCAVGVFDGLHQGHQFLIGEAVREARERGVTATVVTFDRDPDELFLPAGRVRKVFSNEDRLAWLATCGVDYVLVIPFTQTLARTGPRQFLDEVFTGALTPVSVHVGSDFRYGRKAAGEVGDLEAWATGNSCAIHAHALLCEEGLPITATRIRDALEDTRLDEANELLTRPFYLRAQVVPGRRVGQSLGFPTANIVPSASSVTLGDGVYGGYVYLNGDVYRTAVSVGVPATFEGVPATIEAHILDFSGDLYDHEIKVAFVKHLRPMHAFSSPQELQKTVNANIDWVRTNL
ncbi:MAG: riboflavin biosynthesis protein RibF [Coriobacteriales bacterium]|nr:riboflavin biosynthesis protein RibF [Coriobacteriales bacterium]